MTIFEYKDFITWDSAYFFHPKDNIIDITDMITNDLAFGFSLDGKPVDLLDNEYFLIKLR